MAQGVEYWGESIEVHDIQEVHDRKLLAMWNCGLL